MYKIWTVEVTVYVIWYLLMANAHLLPLELLQLQLFLPLHVAVNEHVSLFSFLYCFISEISPEVIFYQLYIYLNVFSINEMSILPCNTVVFEMEAADFLK